MWASRHPGASCPSAARCPRTCWVAPLTDAEADEAYNGQRSAPPPCARIAQAPTSRARYAGRARQSAGDREFRAYVECRHGDQLDAARMLIHRAGRPPRASRALWPQAKTFAAETRRDTARLQITARPLWRTLPLSECVTRAVAIGGGTLEMSAPPRRPAASHAATGGPGSIRFGSADAPDELDCQALKRAAFEYD